MNIIVMVLSFLIIVLFFGYFSQRIQLIRGSMVNKLLIGYVGVLLALSVIYYVMPNKEELVHADTEQYEREADQLYATLLHGDVENIDKKYVKETWKFTYEQGKINIIQPMNRASIIIERTDKLEHEIEVTFYQSPLIFMGADLHEKMRLPEVELLVDSLIINEPEQVRIETSAFTASLIEGQFTGRDTWIAHYPIFRTEVLYVRIPKELKVEDDDNIHYVSSK